MSPDVDRFNPATERPADAPSPAPGSAPIPPKNAPAPAPVAVAVGTVLFDASYNEANELAMVSVKNCAPSNGLLNTFNPDF